MFLIPFMLTCSIMRYLSLFTAGSVSLCYVCGHLWSVCEVFVVPYVDAVTVMRVLLFVLHVSAERV